jgi:citrate synthase
MEDLLQEYVYEDVMHLLIWGQLPTPEQKTNTRNIMSKAAVPPQSVVDVITAFP